MTFKYHTKINILKKGWSKFTYSTLISIYNYKNVIQCIMSSWSMHVLR